MQPELWLVSYDISDDRTRYRVDRLLSAYGERLQKSVFTCRVTVAGLRELRRIIDATIDSSSDSVRLYPLCLWCEARASRSEVNLSPPVSAWWIV